MKKLIFICFMLLTSFSQAASFFDMPFSSTSLDDPAILVTDISPNDNADFYINGHRVVENTSVDVREIKKAILKTRFVIHDFENDSLSIQYSFNSQPFVFMEPYSLKEIKEETAYVTIQKIEYKDKKATVFIVIVGKEFHQKIVSQEKTNHNILFILGALLLIIISIGVSMNK